MKFVRLLLAVRKRGAIAVFVNALAALLGAMAFSEAAYANGSVTGGVITALYNNQQLGNYVFITISGAKSGSPSCQTNGTFQFVLNMSSSNANAPQMYAALLSARVAQSPVSLIGDGSCPTAGSENVIVVIF
jgi:hypothetical protein